VFLFILGMAISTDCLFSLVMKSEFDIALDHTAPDDIFETGGEKWIPANPGRPAIVAFFVLFLVTSVLGTRAAYARHWKSTEAWSGAAGRLPAPQQADLFSSFEDWELVDFKHVNRGEDQLQAEDSYIWVFSDGEVTALISIDCPWDDWHNLNICYTALGWQTEPSYMVPSGSSEFGAPRPGDQTHSEIAMRRDNMYGLVLFSSVDRNGKQLIPPVAFTSNSLLGFVRQIARDVSGSLALNQDEFNRLRGISLPASTLQLLCTHGTEFNDSQLERLHQLYFAACEQILLSPRYRSADGPGREKKPGEGH